MSWTRRFANYFRRRGIEDEIAEELSSHLEEALEQGRSPEEARRAFGNQLLQREQSRDIKFLPWLDSLASDVVFGWRQLRKRPAVSLAAIVSLGLAIGATSAAFRLIDAVLLRTLPVADPQNLFVAATEYTDRTGHLSYRDFDYPTFRRYRDAVADRAEAMVSGGIARRDASISGSSGATETVYRQFVSGNLFPVFGLRPAVGRLFTPDDDRIPGGHPLAVLSYNYWTRRFAGNPSVLGSTLRMEGQTYTVVGVAPKGFIGTEPGSITDVFIPAMMNVDAIDSPGWSWFRMWVRPKPGFSAEQVQQPLQALSFRERQEKVKNFNSGTPRAEIAAFLAEKLVLRPTASGASDLQKQYRRPLLILAVLVGLVLLIACTNVGNLLTAQATARSREMALRVSIGAGQWRLIRLVMVESFLLAVMASALGALFGFWSAPLVVAMLHMPEDPVRLVLDPGWRDLAFSLALAVAVTLVFGIMPALRASNVKPMSALRGGADPHARRRLMNILLAAQMAFCILVQFVAGLFVSTFHHLSTRPLGFSADHLLVLYTDAGAPRTPQFWMEAASQMQAIPGIRSTALAGWPLLEGGRWTVSVRVPGRSMELLPTNALGVSSGWFDTMEIGWIDGRDFRAGELPPRLSASQQPLPGVAIVNEAFARTYFDGRNPVGRVVQLVRGKDINAPMEIVGYVRDAVYNDIHEPIQATVYFPMGENHNNTLLLRTAGDPLALIPGVRHAFSTNRPDLPIQNIQPQTNFLRWQTLRERLLATLSLFFAAVALVLAAVGLYGVLNYSVTWQRREIGIRLALGARPVQIVRRATSHLLGVVGIGLLIGLGAGVACARFVESLLFQVTATDPGTAAIPLFTLLGAALLAAVPPAVRAARIDPVETLRSE